MVLFGATGDLVAKKIAPALFHLVQQKKLPDAFEVVGFSRRDMDHASFREHIAASLVQHKEARPESSFLDLFSFCRGEFTKKKDYARLAETLQKIDAKWGMCTSKLFYLAVPPEFYEPILTRLSSSGLTKPCGGNEGWTRVIVEKPFGKDARGAQKLDEMLGKLFQETQIYRIDHYLAKEMLQNILMFRFSNNIFEQTWNNQSIEQIHARLWETIGVEDRGSFYDGVGALRDVGQNHLLQMIALITMDHPSSALPESIRLSRSAVLDAFERLSSREIEKNTYRAQYEGYQLTQGVSRESRTETYFKIRAYLGTPRWRGVPIILEGGKRMSEARKEIIATFKHPRPCLCQKGEHHKNRVIFSLEPAEGIRIEFWAKKPGFSLETEARTFDFSLRGGNVLAHGEEYEKLLLDCIAGDQTLFVSTDEVRAMWKFIDPIIAGWRKEKTPPALYKPGTDGAARKSLFLEEAMHGRPSLKKELGMIGLGKMGKNLAVNMMRDGWRVFGYTEDMQKSYTHESGLAYVSNIKELVQALTRPRILWLMIPAGAVENVLFGKEGLCFLLDPGDIVIDGGNSFYKDSAARHKKLKKQGIYFVDAGVSGGPGGALSGACLMIGGERKVFEMLEPLFADMALPRGYQFFEGPGAGHFVKMVHNGIEYGMMQAIAEGFSVMKKSDYRLDLSRVADVYNHGSVIESRLIKWLSRAFEIHGENLEGVSGSPAHTGEGEWTVKTAQSLKIKTKIIEEALKFRIQSEKNPSYPGKIISALREQFGGHSIQKRQK